ncbi:hypothetical protein [Nostoc sp. CCY0012]|uniref:hypothetical protein n=1 Tax=Nostoc sp. CCY0012 TaxID=1056123 RepID=UPI0039C61439
MESRLRRERSFPKGTGVGEPAQSCCPNKEQSARSWGFPQERLALDWQIRRRLGKNNT